MWGGVIIQGFAPQFGQGGTGPCFGSGTVCNVVGEGGTVVGNYGGNDPADNSGMLRYVRIAEGGLVAGPNNEINGLTLQGVGHGDFPTSRAASAWAMLIPAGSPGSDTAAAAKALPSPMTESTTASGLQCITTSRTFS